MERVTSLVSPLIRTLILLNQGPSLMTSFNLNHFLRAPFLNTVTLGDRASRYEFGQDTNIQCLTTSPVMTLPETFTQEVLVWRRRH